MAYVIDSRNSGGAVVVLGDALTLPADSGTPTQANYPPIGSLRFNPSTQGLEVFRTDGNSGYSWQAIEQIAVNTGSFYSTSGGPISGNIVFTNNGKLFASNGNASFPSISFDQSRGTGLSITNGGDLQLSSQSLLTAIIGQNGVAISGQLVSSAAQITTLTATSIQATSIQTQIPHQISAFMRGTYAGSQVIYRYVAAHALTFAASLVGSYAYAQTAPTASVQCGLFKVSGGTSAQVGTIGFLNNSTTGSFAMASSFTMQPGDVLELIAPVTADVSFAGVFFNLLAQMSTT